MVLQVPAYPNSEWSEDYLPKFACAARQKLPLAVPRSIPLVDLGYILHFTRCEANNKIYIP